MRLTTAASSTIRKPPRDSHGEVDLVAPILPHHLAARGAAEVSGCSIGRPRCQELAFSTVTARRFCDQQDLSLQTATGRSLP